jgi:hypothetical protein
MGSEFKNRSRFIWIVVILLAIIGLAVAVRRTLIVENVIS